jgi:phage baseplate assembly protein gpV
MKYLSVLLLVAFLTAGVAVSGCMDREETIYDTSIVLQDGSNMVYDLAAGTYKVQIVSDEKIDVTFDTASTYDSKGVTVYDQVFTLGSATKMTVENPSFLALGLAGPANVQIKVIKNPANV